MLMTIISVIVIIITCSSILQEKWRSEERHLPSLSLFKTKLTIRLHLNWKSWGKNRYRTSRSNSITRIRQRDAWLNPLDRLTNGLLSLGRGFGLKSSSLPSKSTSHCTVLKEHHERKDNEREKCPLIWRVINFTVDLKLWLETKRRQNIKRWALRYIHCNGFCF